MSFNRSRGLAALTAAATGLLTLALSASPQAQPTNAATLYKQALKHFEGDLDSPGGLLTAQELNALYDVDSPRAVTPEIRAILAKARPAIQLARQASRLDACDFELDRSEGFAMLIPHIGEIRRLARLLRAEAMTKVADGDADGLIDDYGALAGMSRHVTSDRLLIGSLVGAAMANLNDQGIQQAIDLGLLDQERAQRLIEALAPLSGSDPFRCADALDEEGDMLAVTVTASLDDPGALVEFMGSIADGIAPDDAEAMTGAAREELLGQLATSRQLLARSAEAFREPDSARARAMLDEVEAAVHEGVAGALGRILLPSLRPVYEGKQRSEAMLAQRLAQLRDLASGAKKPEDFANAALAYLAAARAATAMSAEDQRLIEAARLTLGAVEDPFTTLITKALERHRASVIAPLIEGGKAGRCSFGRDRSPHGGVVVLPTYSAGLRAAARTALAEAMMHLHRAGQEQLPQEQRDAGRAIAVDALEAVLRLAHHVSRDAALAHSHLVQSILDETVEPLGKAWSSSALDDGDRARLRVAVERLDRIDPLGYRQALATDRDAILARSPGARHEDIRRLRRKALEALDANALFSCGLILQARDAQPNLAWTMPATPGEPAPTGLTFDCWDRGDDLMLDLADLYATDACQALLARAAEVLSAPIFAAEDAKTLASQPGLPGDPVPVLADVSGRARAASALLGSLDQIMRSKAALTPSSPRPSGQ